MKKGQADEGRHRHPDPRRRRAPGSGPWLQRVQLRGRGRRAEDHEGGPPLPLCRQGRTRRGPHCALRRPASPRHWPAVEARAPDRVGQARCLRRSLPRRLPRATHVPVRDAGGRVRDPPRLDARRRCPVLRRERAVAGPCLGTRPQRRNPRRSTGPPKETAQHDRQRPGGGDARGPALRRHDAASKCRRPPARRPEIDAGKRCSISERLEGRRRRRAWLAGFRSGALASSTRRAQLLKGSVKPHTTRRRSPTSTIEEPNNSSELVGSAPARSRTRNLMGILSHP